MNDAYMIRKNGPGVKSVPSHPGPADYGRRRPVPPALWMRSMDPARSSVRMESSIVSRPNTLPTGINAALRIVTS